MLLLAAADLHGSGPNPALTVALAIAAGMIAQTLARHLRLPGIVLLLAVGVLLGPDIAGVIRPDALGSGLQALVGFAVAVILFEGGLNLDIKRLIRERGVIQRLLTIGAVITALGGSLTAWWVLGWDWRLAVAFGSLVIVTGPTVITPLLRRIKVDHSVETVLEAEGVLIDAIGAVLAVVVLEVVTVPLSESLADGMRTAALRLGFGIVAGLVAGLLLAQLLRFRKLIPEGLENVFTLALVWALFQGSNAWQPESGVMTVTVAGLVVGNTKIRTQRHLLEFKEQLTVMLIGMLFVLLAADVRLADLRALGSAGLITVLVLMLVVRPINAFVCTAGSSLSWRERSFIAWLAPRGVVAAAIASLFATSLTAAGIEGGKSLQALVFLVIAMTVVVQGLSGGIVARLLGLKRPEHLGYAILGANELGREIAEVLRRRGKQLVLLDSNPIACQATEKAGFQVIYGNVMEERTLQRAQLEARACCVAVTANQEVNLLFARSAAHEFKVPFVYVAVRRDQSSVNEAVVAKAGADLLFGSPRDLDMWAVRLRRELVIREVWVADRSQKRDEPDGPEGIFDVPETLVLPLVITRGNAVYPVSRRNEIRKDDEADVLVFSEQADKARAWLRERGWVPQPDATEQASGEPVVAPA